MRGMRREFLHIMKLKRDISITPILINYRKNCDCSQEKHTLTLIRLTVI